MLAACRVHSRRKFYEIVNADGSPVAIVVVRRIAELYAIEEKIRAMQLADRLA